MIYEIEVFNRFRGGRVLPDANLLLLLLVGSFERARIEKFKRTASYSGYDFDLLAGFLRAFETIVTTPHILTEVSNLGGGLPEYLKLSWNRHFAMKAQAFGEVFEEAKSLMREAAFLTFGLTDSAICAMAKGTLILTDDFKLSGFLRSRNLPVLNFRDLATISRIRYS